jgi:hypothetical protein
VRGQAKCIESCRNRVLGHVDREAVCVMDRCDDDGNAVCVDRR